MHTTKVVLNQKRYLLIFVGEFWWFVWLLKCHIMSEYDIKCMGRIFVYHSKNISLRQSCLDLCCGKRARLPPQTMSGVRVKTWEEATLWLRMWHLWKQCEVCEKFWGNTWRCGTSGLARPRMGESALTSFLLFTMKEVDKDYSYYDHQSYNHTLICFGMVFLVDN